MKTIVTLQGYAKEVLRTKTGTVTGQQAPVDIIIDPQDHILQIGNRKYQLTPVRKSPRQKTGKASA